MIVNDRFVGTFGRVRAGDPEELRNVVVGAVRAGYAVVVNKPGSKEPMCTLTVRDAKAADMAAKEDAKERGDRFWDRRVHKCGFAHALTDDKVANRVMQRMIKTYGHVNIGLDPGRSKLLVVDVDTAEERQAFLDLWAARTGEDMSAFNPTVLSPGSRTVSPDGTETWSHRDGGHYWFYLPEGVELPEQVGKLKLPGGACAMWRDCQVLVPPSARSEGVYKLVSPPSTAPDWLVEYITGEAGKVAHTAAERRQALLSSNSPIDRWAATASWSEILEPDGWVDTGKLDRCGCPIWTSPGVHSSPRSALAHDVGCEVYDMVSDHGPLYVFTDNPPEHVQLAIDAKGTRALTKFVYLQYRFYEGDSRATLRGLGLGDATDLEFPGFESATHSLTESPESVTHPGPLTDSDVTEEAVEQLTDEIAGLSDEVRALLAAVLNFDDLGNLTPKPPLIEGVLDLESIVRISGKSNHGKTFVMLDLSLHVASGRAWHGHATAQGCVFYVAAEGQQGIRKRAEAWAARHGKEFDSDDFRVLPMPVQATDAQAWHRLIRVLEHVKPVLVVFDTQSRITVGADENSARDMGIFVERLEAVKRATRACVAVVHHLGHQGDHARGSTSVLGAMDTELRVEKEGPAIKVVCTKQKEHEFFGDILLTLEAEGDSAVIAATDPMDVFTAQPYEVPLHIRLAKIIHETAPLEGITRAEAKSNTVAEYAIRPSNRSNILRAWNKLVRDGWIAEYLDDNHKGTGKWYATPVAVREIDQNFDDSPG
jgi:AAA domain/Bifunctional DNA primase/polymerase, N-terminal